MNCFWATGLATGGWGTCGLVFAPSTAFRPTDVGGVEAFYVGVSHYNIFLPGHHFQLD